MRAHTPKQGLDASQRRSSIGGGDHRASFGSSIPRVQSRIALARAANAQPSFDFLTGEPVGRPPSRERFGASVRAPPGEHKRENTFTETEIDYERRRKELDELKAEVKTLKYTIDNHKQEEELAKLRFESELREARRKGEEDFKQRQAAEGERNKAVRQYESLQKEITEIRDAAANEKAALERQVRELEVGKRTLEEEVEDIKHEHEENSRNAERRVAELQSRNDTLQRTVEELQQDSDQRETLLQDVQQQLVEKDTANGALEAEVLRLKAQTGDVDTLAIIKRELSEQVTHIRSLEAKATELKHLKRLHKSIEVVEEEKRSLQRKVDAMEDLQNELGEARIQRQRLEDERLAWTAYLQSQAGTDGQLEFDSPEALARALVEERLQTATLVERIGALEPEILEKDSIIEGLQGEKNSLAEQIEKLKLPGGSGGSGNDSKARLRLERQRALAIKEVEYLRAQLKTFDTEDATFQPGNVDEAKLKRIEELEIIVDQYRQEVQTLQAELATIEGNPPNPESAGSKRHRDSGYGTEDNERIGQMTRKNRKLQDDLSALQTAQKLLQKELSVAEERLKAFAKSSETRIISLRSNPTSDYEAIKLSTLNALRKENADLLSQLTSSHPTPSSVPLSALKALERDVHDAEANLASEKLRNDRLKKVWAAKTREFREAICSLLGWDLVFLPDGKTKVTSYFYPSKDDEENSIVFDGERGTMKISGGPESKFARKIMGQIKFWVRERACIPGLLAALTLEFYEEKRGDGTLRVEL